MERFGFKFFFMYVYFLKCMPLKSKLAIIYEYLLKQYLIFTIVFQSSTEGKSFFIKHLNIIHFQHSFNDYMLKQFRKELYHLIRMYLFIGLKGFPTNHVSNLLYYSFLFYNSEPQFVCQGILIFSRY